MIPTSAPRPEPSNGSPAIWRSLRAAAATFHRTSRLDTAATLTHYALLSVFPALLMVVAIAGVVGRGPGATDAILEVIGRVGPESATGTFRGTVDGVVRGSGSAGALLGVGFLGSLWSATGWLDAFFRVANDVAGVEERRSFPRRKLTEAAFALVLAVGIAALACLLVVSGPVAQAAADWVGAGDGLRTAWSVLQWPVAVILAIAMVSAVYWIAPCVRRRRWPWITVGAAAAVCVWLAGTALFGVYVANFGSYNATYGALGGVIVFLLWLWLTNAALIFGAILDVTLERDRGG